MPEYLSLVRGGRPPPMSSWPKCPTTTRRSADAPADGITEAQGDALGRGSDDVPVAVGMRNWSPFIKDALAGLAAGSHPRHRGPLAPQFSTLSVEKYIERRARAARRRSIRGGRVLYAHPMLLDAFAERLRAAQPSRASWSCSRRTASRHGSSSPAIATRRGRRNRRGVAERAGVATYTQAYQSAGRTPEPWIGPTLDSLIDEQSARGPQVPGGSDRLRLRPHRDPVRHRRPGAQSRASSRRRCAARSR